ncbi:hypothetical protein KEM48_002110 [Puccinia striiformis f. sp. tritici PST-130]|nr:hypothetical protein KEM48_002110 [Puccinia striiformis f. sp. tritici PST-130]
MTPCFEKSRFSHRPDIISLLPLAPNVKAAPIAEVLSKIGKPIHNQPFDDICPDPRLACWNRSIHVFPAAYPRSVTGSAVREAVLPTYPHSQDRVTIAHDIRDRNAKATKRRELGQAIDEPQLFIAAARYFNTSESEKPETIRTGDEEEPITFILTHANGFHKETWEPMLAHLILSAGGRKIKEIWALDCVNQVDWADYARDLLNFVLSYLPDQSSSESGPPMVLPHLDCPNPPFLQLDSSPCSTQCDAIRWRHRRLGLIGHSIGGCAAMLAATSIPELFHDVILIDPAIRPVHDEEIATAIRLASSAVTRKDQWENRIVALKKFQKNSNFYGRWNPQVLRRYIEYGLESDHPVKLKCNKLHEASVFTQPHNRVSEAYFRSLDLFYENIIPKKQRFPFGNPHHHHPPFRFLLILGNSTESIVPETTVENFGFAYRLNCSGHLIVQENPIELASSISEHLIESNSSSYYDEERPTHTLCKL